MKETISSRFRSGFWVTQGIGVGILVGIIIGLLYGYFTEGSGFFLVILVVMTGFLWYTLAKLLNSDYKHYTVTQEGIDIYYPFRKRHSFVEWDEVTRIVPGYSGSDEDSVGSHSVSIEIGDDRIVHLNENEYENYSELAYALIFYYKVYLGETSE